MIPPVVASDRGRAQTGVVPLVHHRGCRTTSVHAVCERNVLEISTIEGDSPVREAMLHASAILSNAGHEKSCANLPGPSGKAKYSRETDSERVP